MKFGFMAKHRGAWPVAMMCETLGVSRSGFYAWLNRPRSQRSQVDEVLASQVRQSFVVSDRTYGARRVWHDILALGQQCGLHRIERLMREQALRARPRRRGLPRGRGQRSAIAQNVLDRQFQADGPNQKWVADFTYVWTLAGFIYVSFVTDVYSRRILGWRVSASKTTPLVTSALEQALFTRRRGNAAFTATGLLHTRMHGRKADSIGRRNASRSRSCVMARRQQPADRPLHRRCARQVGRCRPGMWSASSGA